MSNLDTVTSAAEYAGVSRMQAYRWARNDPEFSAAWRVARVFPLVQLKKTAFDLAKQGNVQLIKFLIAQHEAIAEKQRWSLLRPDDWLPDMELMGVLIERYEDEYVPELTSEAEG